MNKIQKMTKKNRNILIRFIPVFFFLMIFTVGISVNEPQRVLEQAWNVCLDCIGIG